MGPPSFSVGALWPIIPEQGQRARAIVSRFFCWISGPTLKYKMCTLTAACLAAHRISKLAKTLARSLEDPRGQGSPRPRRPITTQSCMGRCSAKSMTWYMKIRRFGQHTASRTSQAWVRERFQVCSGSVRSPWYCCGVFSVRNCPAAKQFGVSFSLGHLKIIEL